MRKLMSSLAAAILLGAAATPAALAQSLLSDAPAPVPAVSLKGLGESTILSTRPVALGRAGEALSLTSFEQSRSALMLMGEDDVVNLTFVLDAGRIAEGGDLVIAYRNAVSVMPEASTLEVMINGSPAGEFPIRSPSGFDSQLLSVSPALLRAGVNEVRLRAVQRHRVDCSMEATYELWTEIDSQHSGFRSRSAIRPLDLASLRTLGRTENGLTDLRLILPEGAGTDALNRAAPVVQTLALALNRDDLSVTVAQTGGHGPGIDLVIVTDDDPASLKAAGGNAPYGLSVAGGSDDARVRVVLHAATAGDIPGLLMNAVQGPLKPVLDTGVRAPRKGEIRAEAKSAYTLADAGYVAAPFSGRLFHTRFDMILPADFYPAEYATMDLALHAATSPGLKPTSQLLVRVNGHIVRSLPMRDTDGEVFSGRRLELPLRAFRPGRNQIELLAELERAADDACVFAERDDSVPRFILLDTTEIRVPALARVARSPELAALAGSAYPYAGPAGVDVHALRPDANSVSAAMTMIAKMSLAARAPVLARIAFGPPRAGEGGNAIVIAPKRAIDELSQVEPDADAAVPQTIDFARAEATTDPMSTASVHLPGAAMAMAVTTDPAALLDAFQQTTRGLARDTSPVRDLGAGVSERFHALLNWLNYQRPSDAAPLVEPRRKAMLAQSPSVTGEGVVTWLTAETSLDMLDAAAMLADPTVWNRLEGETVVFDLDAHTIRTTRPQAYFAHDIRDYGPGNLRRIAAAWFSDHFRIYVALVLGLVAVFAIWLGRAVPRAGVRTDQ
ncbi:MAG: cellulose biosynthesis cyclic di-GMP-binding regulatory protein BcsB [Hoeflea sp.]|uniref:cellulose biosynthesis cyclic di-GMP-binding regulatory protein BcsB n=1 Tax=Hoeflea sp. TaxID=1940281 RepID=UPI0027305378|nr:cellulose biosynthesis cyclic di-GMP-binding regulatory protein BcsB [Hoeflea sp.]MDP2122654.1 cellulose biosynthesis cyclic di-GMP-binding regulatory protein BcsB [Hoeflea sp.]